jgi:hypothetical protein
MKRPIPKIKVPSPPIYLPVSPVMVVDSPPKSRAHETQYTTDDRWPKGHRCPVERVEHLDLVRRRAAACASIMHSRTVTRSPWSVRWPATATIILRGTGAPLEQRRRLCCCHFRSSWVTVTANMTTCALSSEEAAVKVEPTDDGPNAPPIWSSR